MGATDAGEDRRVSRFVAGDRRTWSGVVVASGLTESCAIAVRMSAARASIGSRTGLPDALAAPQSS
jgi:hypothetical protein